MKRVPGSRMSPGVYHFAHRPPYVFFGRKQANIKLNCSTRYLYDIRIIVMTLGRLNQYTVITGVYNKQITFQS